MRDGLQHDNDDSIPSVYRQGAETVSARRLIGDARFGTVVVGAGLTGLAAALHAAVAGDSVAVVEANGIGTGASGRSFGQVVPYLKHEPGHALRHFGSELGGRLVDAAASGPDHVFGLIEQYQIACEALRSGLIFAAHSVEGLERLSKRAAYWRSRGARVDMLDQAATAAAIGGGSYPGALLDHRGGTLNSFAFARGLARAAVDRGTVLFDRTPVCSIRQGGSSCWQVQAELGSLRAERVLICTNAYRHALAPGIGKRVLPIRVHQVASQPLAIAVASTILPGGRALTDTRRLPSGVRMTRDRRLVVTVEGPLFAHDGGNVAGAAARIAHLFPDLGPLTWETAWSGWIDMSPDQYPHIYEPAPGLLAGLGLSGRGLALGPLLGRDLVRRAFGSPAGDLSFDIAGPKDGPRWPVGARIVASGVAMQRRWHDRLDAWRARLSA